jgi:eukaryotic-like serine/threonine-protein kinase
VSLSPNELAERLERDGRPYEAAAAWGAGGEHQRALASLTRVGRGDSRYREACRAAIRLAGRCGPPTLPFENMLAAYVRSGPRDDSDAEAFAELAEYYDAHGFVENAAEAHRKLERYREADVRVSLRVRHPTPRAIPEDEALPELPDLPGLPSAAGDDFETAEAAARDRRITQTSPPEESIAAPFRIGSVLGGRYRLEEKIGVGGMSLVFRASDMELDDFVAVKVFKEAIYDRESDERLRREVRMSHQLVHPNVVQLYDMGTEQGLRYITMELLTGYELRARMHGRPMLLDEALGLLAQVCAGLEAAHELGIIHRDVKPENCFITKSGVLKVMDFGIAKLRSAPGLTVTGSVAGTPGYMAPEQIISFRDVTFAADIYSLGAMAYEAFTGRLPFDEPESIRVMMRHATEPAPPPRRYNPDLPLELEEIVMECLEKDPVRRPQSAGDLGKRLEDLRGRV